MNHPHTFLITLILAPLAALHAAETVAIPDGWRGSAGPGKVSAAAGAVAVERDAEAADDFAAVAEAQDLGEGFYVFSGKARTAATASGAATILARKASGESLREWKTPQLDAGCSGWRDFSVRLFATAETAKFQLILTSSAGKVEFKDLKLEKTTWLEGRGTAAPKLEFWINMDYYDNVTSCKVLGLEGYGEKEITDYFKTCRQKGVTGVHWRASALGQMQYPSKVATPFPGRLKMERLDPDQARFAKTLTEIDPLAIAVREAKKNSIELYLWMTLIDEGYNHPTIGDFFFSDFQLDHPHTMLLNRKGEPLKGTICYNEPEAFAYRINIVKELLSYGADGLYLCNRTHNWSFGRNDGDEYGFNPAVVAEYRKRYGTDILTQDFDVKKWRGIRAEAYDRLIEEVAKLTHAAGQKVRLGVGNSALSGGPLGPNWGKLRVDWRRYVKEGWVDSIVSGQDKLSHYLAGAEMNQFRRVAKAGQKLYFWAEMNNWRGGGMYPPEDLLQQAEAFAFFGANGGIHHESLNLESADGVTKYFDPLTQFYLSVNSAGAAVPSASSSPKPQDIEWSTPQFIANSRQPPDGMMHPGEIRLAGPRTMQAGEPLRCGLRAVPPAVPNSYHGVYRKVELRPELRIALLDAQGKTVASEPLNFAPEQWQRVPLANEGLPPGNYTLRGEILVEGGSVFSRVDKDLRVLPAEEFKKLAALQKDARGIADAAGLKTTKLVGGPATLGEAVLIPKGCETAIALPGQGRVAVYGLLAPPSATFVATLGATKRNMSAFQDETYIMREVFLGVGSGGVDTVRVLSGEGEVRFAGIRVEPLSEDVSFVPGAGNQGRQLVVNNDGASEGFHNPGWSPQSVLEQVDRYQGSDVSQFEFQTHLGEMANYRSRYVDFYGEHFKGTWPTKGYEAQFRHYDLLDKQEPRLFPRLNARCGEIGLTFWGSQRMNADYGYHAEYAELFHSRFQKEHPEVRVQKSPSDTEPSFLLSYANAGVRERRIGVLRELAEFGCAGVNLDFCRYPTVLGYEEPMLKRFTEAYGGDGTTVPFDDPRWTRVRQEVMNGFLREVREAMNEEGKKRGRSVRVSVRLPATKYETFGFDPQTWVREGLVDVLIPAFPGWERWFDIAPWVAMAKGSKVEVWPGTEYYFHETSTGELTDQDFAAGKKPGAMWILSRADYLRRAAEAYAAGAQGFYMFNAWGKQHVHLTRGISDSKFVANWRRYLDPENLGSEMAMAAKAIVTVSASADLPRRSERNVIEPELSADQFPRTAATEPADALATFEVSPGFALSLAAHEPAVIDPIAMTFDEKGRAYVVEMIGYSERREDAVCRIRLLTDADGDGVFEKNIVFKDKLKWPSAILCYKGGVFVGATPDLYYFKDTDGDGICDEQRTVFTGFGGGNDIRLNMQALFNSLRWGPDNRIWGATAANGGTVTRPDEASFKAVNLRGSDFSFDPEKLDLRHENGTAQYGMSFDSHGRRFVCSNSRHLIWVAYERHQAKINPWFSLPAPLIDIPADGPAPTVYRISPDEPWRIVRTRWRVAGVDKGIVEGGGRVSGFFVAASGIHLYWGNAFPAEFRDNAFVGDVGSNLIHRKIIRETKGSVQPIGSRAETEEKTEFLRSRDTWFRPTSITSGPDGCLYVTDMYREVIEHPWSLPAPIKKHLDLNSGNDRGRIYRIAPVGYISPKISDLGALSDDELMALTKHENDWHRTTARRLLYERGKAVAPMAPHAPFPAVLASRTPLLDDLPSSAGDPWMEAAVLNSLRSAADLGAAWEAAKASPAPFRAQLAGMIGRSGDTSLLAVIIRDLADHAPDATTAALLTSLREGISRARGDWRAFASDPRWNALTGRASTTLASSSSPVPARVDAVRLLSLLTPDPAQKTFRSLLLDGNPDPALAAALVEAITDLDFLVARFGAVQSARDELGSRILASPKSSTAFLAAIREGKITLSDAPASLIENLRRHADAGVKALAAKVLPPVVSRADVIAAYQPALAKKGDAEKGKAVFGRTCIACHVSHEGLGVKLGPALASFAAAGAETLLGNILDPNREVAPQYQAYTFEFTSGPPATGFIVTENSAEITLRQPGGMDRTFPRSEVTSMKGMGRSIMPEGLEATMTVDEMADLIAYILKNP